MATSVATALAGILNRLDAAEDYSTWHWQDDTPPDVICIGAVLVQHTQWSNVELAMTRLGEADALSLAAIVSMTEERLAGLLRPAGTPAVKARRLLALARLAQAHGGLHALLSIPSDELRPLLLNTQGIGPETADAILLYAAGRPVFVIDAYTTRIFRRLGLGPEHNGYDAWQQWFEGELAADSEAYRRYHALIVLHGKFTCRPKPKCASCCLVAVCRTGRASA
jgi:endonuclease-3 related protein